MRQCTGCSSMSPSGAKFCVECGQPFARTCPACGTPAAGRFCQECGTAIGPPAPAAAPAVTGPPAVTPAPVSERRTTTVLFGDLVSFTTLSEQREPEEVRELLSAYFAVARTVVGRYGGTLEKFIGDAVMAVWGVPVSHEDDAERAVRAALDMVAEVAALGESVGAPDLQLRVGITTGSVAVVLGAVNEGMVAGDAVNTAARVQTAAAPGAVWTDQETRGLTAAAVSYSDMGEHALKGKTEPVRLFRADAIVAAVGGAQRVDGLEAPMVGREAEMRRVKELFHATEADGRPRVVVVTGGPGLGKSRLGWEFEKYVDGLSDFVRWHRGRSLSYGEGVAFWAFAEMVRSRLGLLETDDPDTVRLRVREGAEVVAADPLEADWLVPRLEALLGAWTGAAFERSDLFAAWTTFLDRVGGSGETAEPVILLFEDMQYADSGLLDLLEHLLQSTRAALFVLVLTRPELLEERPSLASGRRATVLDLGSLDEAAMRALVDGLVLDLPDRARTAIVERSDGVPLYAVETVRALIDREAVTRHDGRYVFVDHDHARVDLGQLTAPTSLQTLIASRLDSLGPVERRTVQDASVLGLSFRASGLVALADANRFEIDQALAALVRKGVVEAQDDPRSPELGQYRFHQALVREVAYSTLTRKDRRARHLAAAAHLESEEGEVRSGVTAQHLLDALGATGPSDPDRTAIVARARGHLTDAARRAHGLGSFAEALDSARGALALDPDPLERGHLLELAARAAYGGGQSTTSGELAAEAVAVFDAHGHVADVVRGVGMQARLAHVAGRAHEALSLGERALGLLREHPDVGPLDAVEVLTALGNAARALGDFDRCLELSLLQLKQAEESADPGLVVRGLNAVAISMTDAGSPTAYLALLHEAVEIARGAHALMPLGQALSNLTAELYPTDLTRALQVAEEAVEVTRQVGDPMLIDLAMSNAGFAWILAGRWDEALSMADVLLADREANSFAIGVAMVRAQLESLRGMPLSPVQLPPMTEDPWERLCLALCGLLAGPGDDREALEELVDRARDAFGSGDYFEDIEMLWAPAVELVVRAGMLAEAEEMLGFADPLVGNRARPLLRGEVARLRALLAAARGDDPEPDLRVAIMHLEEFGAVYLAARARLELARSLRDRAPDEAADLVVAARRVFSALGAAPALAEADALVPDPAGTAR